MRPVFYDCESYYDRKSGYSLSHMPMEQYIRDSRFQLHGAAIQWDLVTSPQWYDERELRYILKEEDWSDVFLISHHAQWDHAVLSWRYNVHPKMSGCTMSMSRLMLGSHIGVSLDSIRKEFGLSPKITPYNLFEGKRWSELSDSVRQQVADGAIDEVTSKVAIFKRLLQMGFPPVEFDLIDSIVKMYSEPSLRGDVQMLAGLWVSEETKKRDSLRDLGYDLSTDEGRKHAESELQSADRFADLLRAEGIEPETKTSPKGNEIYAFSKKDDFMRDVLLEHPNERISLLAQARLNVKSTILQTRAEKLGRTAERGPLPVYLRYAGAGTLRPTGGEGDNWLNFKRGSTLRRSICAPEGFWLAPVDSSQIECRCLHYLAGGPDEPVIQKFRRGEDPYVDLSSQFYGEPIYKPEKGDPRKEEMEAKRGMGKQGRLMCGYGASGRTFKATAKAGLYGPPVDIPIEDADAFVALYRRTNPSICHKLIGYWAQADQMLHHLATGATIQWGPLEVRDHRVWVQERPIIYDSLEFHHPAADEDAREVDKGGYWRLKTRFGWKTMWGSKLVQNMCEGVARVIVSDAMSRIKAKYGILSRNWPYDELLLCIPKGAEAEQTLELCKAEMRVTPDWLPGLPLDCDGALGDRYSK